MESSTRWTVYVYRYCIHHPCHSSLHNTIACVDVSLVPQLPIVNLSNIIFCLTQGTRLQPSSTRPFESYLRHANPACERHNNSEARLFHRGSRQKPPVILVRTHTLVRLFLTGLALNCLTMYHDTIDLIIICGLFMAVVGIWKGAQYAAVRYARPDRQSLLSLYKSQC